MPAVHASKSLRNSNRQSLSFVNGDNLGIGFFIHSKDTFLDLSQQEPTIRLALEVPRLLTSRSNLNIIRVVAYELIDGEEVINIANITTRRKSLNDEVNIDFKIGNFASPTREIFFDVYDGDSKFVSTFKTTIEATNIQAPNQTSSITCNDIQDDCFFQKFLENVSFEANPTRRVEVQVYKGSDGKYVQVPYGLNRSRFLQKIRVKDLGSNGSSLDLEGRLGIGVENPLARVHIANGKVPDHH